mmetsp:Transcript_54380/g.168841  ORF Transcript_54380/g.168841 Transcript_54380/m.168841 type:complete len:213 (-) Transcript_54380:276-914(-)
MPLCCTSSSPRLGPWTWSSSAPVAGWRRGPAGRPSWPSPAAATAVDQRGRSARSSCGPAPRSGSSRRSKYPAATTPRPSRWMTARRLCLSWSTRSPRTCTRHPSRGSGPPRPLRRKWTASSPLACRSQPAALPAAPPPPPACWRTRRPPAVQVPSCCCSAWRCPTAATPRTSGWGAPSTWPWLYPATRPPTWRTAGSTAGAWRAGGWRSSSA